MIVNRIDLAEASFDPERSLHQAVVTMNVTGPDGTQIELSYSCHTSQPADCPSTLVLYGLIKHAFDQARLLPVFRGARERVNFDLGQVVINAA